MPLPTLNTEGINILPGLTTAANLRSASQQNYLNQLKIQDYEKNKEYQKGVELFDKKIKFLNAVKDFDNAGDLYEQQFGEKLDITKKGEDVVYDFGDGPKIKLNSKDMAEMIEATAKDHSWWTDPAKKARTEKWVLSRGGSIEYNKPDKEKDDIKITDQEIDAIALGIKKDPRYTQNQAQLLRDERLKTKKEIAVATASGKVEGVIPTEDADRNADLVIRGLETFDYFKNVFGVSVQEQVRKAILRKDPNYNFLERRASVGALMKSMENQEKQRGMMGSFVSNIEKQIGRVDEMAQKLSRIDVRILDMPMRAARTKLKGSGFEKAYEAYLLEISNEIAKLSTGSSASIRELSTDAQERWAKIHDPNLSLNEMKIILDETKRMASMRLESTDEELKRTAGELKTRGVKVPGATEKPKPKFEILKVE